MGKNPCFLFFPGDWTRDMDDHPLEIEGAWIRICCRLWWSPQKGRLTLTPDRWATILRMDIEAANRTIDYLLNEKIASGKREYNGNITLWSRRMIKDEEGREFNKLRQKRFRTKERCNANVTPPSQDVSVSVSVSDTNIIKKINKRKCLPDLPEGLKKETWDAFVEVRKTMKAPLTRHASTLVISRLKKLSGNNGEIMELILQQSIVNGYRGVFPLKEGKQGDGYIIPEYKSEEMPLTTDTEREKGKKILKEIIEKIGT